jgi:hypothetical protein
MAISRRIYVLGKRRCWFEDYEELKMAMRREEETDGTQNISLARGLAIDSPPQIDQMKSQSEASPLAATVVSPHLFCSFKELDSMRSSEVDYPY